MSAYQAIFESLPNPVIVYSLDGRIREVNPAACSFYGYDRDGFLALTLFDLINPEKEQVVANTLRRVAAGESFFLMTEDISGAGETLSIEVSVSPLTYEGESCGLGIVRDISEFRWIEQTLREHETRYRQILDSMSSGVAVYEVLGEGEDFIFVDINRAVERIEGLRKEEIEGKRITTVFPGVKEFGLFEIMRQVWLTGEPAYLPPTHYRDERISGWRENHVFRLSTHEIVVVYDDITGHVESEVRFRTLFERSADGILIADVETRRFVLANPAICALLGYDADDLLELSVHDIHPSDRLEYVLREFESQARGEKTIARDIPCLRADGTIIYADINTTSAELDGRLCNIGFFRDVTERRETERTLQERTVELGERVKELRTLYGFADLARREELPVNELLQEAVGLIPAGWQYPDITSARITLRGHVFTTPDFRESAWCLDREIRLAGEPAGRIEVFYTEERPERDEGPFLAEERDLIEALAESLALTIHHLEATEELRRSRYIIDSASDFMSLRDREYRYLAVNETYMDAFGLTRGEIVGRTTADLLGEEVFTEKIKERFDRCLTGESLRVEEWFDLPVWGRRYIEEAFYPFISPDGEIAGVVTASRDLTEWKTAQEEHRQLQERLERARKLESIGVLAGGIAHEFNNLLTSMLGNADMARHLIPPASPAYSNLEQIVASSRRAADLVSQMLAYAGRGAFLVEKMDLSQIVRDMTDMLGSIVPDDVVLELDLADDLPAIEIDPAQVRQIVKNLATNAVEALAGEIGTITIETGRMRTEDRFDPTAWTTPGDPIPEEPGVYLEVSDTGTGMDETVLARVFEPFFSTRFTGRGLGLSAVMGIMHGHGGTVLLQSRPGEGTRARIVFPISKSA